MRVETVSVDDNSPVRARSITGAISQFVSVNSEIAMYRNPVSRGLGAAPPPGIKHTAREKLIALTFTIATGAALVSIQVMPTNNDSQEALS